MTDQKDLFQPEPDRKVDRLTRNQFERILKKGFDPAYVLKIEPDDRVTVAERPMSVARAYPKEYEKTHEKSEVDFSIDDSWTRPTIRHCIVLSKSRLDRNRRIVAQTDSQDKQWLIGLYVGLLRRQVREGTRDIKAWAFEMILDLERTDVGFVNQITLDNWTRDLIAKDDQIQNMKNLRRKKKGDPA